MEADFGLTTQPPLLGTSASPSSRSSSSSSSMRQYLQDSVVAAGAAFAMLGLQQQVMRHARNDFHTMAWMLLWLSLFQGVAAWWTRHQQNATTTQFVQAVLKTEVTHRLLLNGARIVVQCYVRADALHHFGFFFAFLLENVGALLLQPLRDAYLARFQPLPQRRDASFAWMLLLAGYLLVAGVDAYEYGSLVHTLLLLVAALTMKLGEYRTVETKLRLATSPHFHLLSLVWGCVFALPLSLLIRPRARRTDVASELADHEQSAVVWMLCGMGVAALQLTALYFHRNPVSAGSSRNRWLSGMACTVTGLLGSLMVSALEDDLLRWGVDLVAALMIVAAHFAELRRISMDAKAAHADAFTMANVDLGLGLAVDGQPHA